MVFLFQGNCRWNILNRIEVRLGHLFQKLAGIGRKTFYITPLAFRMMTRLAEECGELAAQVNHFENIGIKRQKHGEPDRYKLAKEVQDVIRCALQIAAYYHIEAELEKTIETSYQKMKTEGLIES
jgi:NTP pyrophosphatase (non-canonical NTP hydrolase)